VRGREVQLVRRPRGWPVPDDAEVVETELPEPADGEVLVRNVLMSVDPYMRGRMNDVASYVPPYPLHGPMDGGAVGEVVASRAAELPVGSVVLHGKGWREYAVLPARQVRPVDPAAAPLSAYLGVLGMPGMTAYVGLLDVAAVRDGETVFVSGAAGAVGGVVGQIARTRGCRVIGSAGSAEKVARVRDELGFDAVFSYRDGPVARSLAAAAPDGIDVYFDNVGGEHLEAAIGALRDFGRVAMCGAISAYNAEEPPPGPRNLTQVVRRRLTLRGFIVSDHESRRPAFLADMTRWLAERRVSNVVTVVEGGVDAAFGAFLGLLRGDNVGKMLVRLGPHPG
jgi:NADPH-dependent curcumin reductase CurA